MKDERAATEKLESYRKFCLNVCVDLEYAQKYIDLIKESKTENEISRYMTTARNAWA